MILRADQVSDPYGHLDDASRELVARVIRLAVAGVPHRLVSRFDLVDGVLSVGVSLERKRLGRWATVRPEAWIPLVASTNGLYAMLLYVAEHGRLPDPTDPPTEKTP